MPFLSKAQARWMFKHRPGMAEEWAAMTPNISKLPEHTKKAGKRGKVKRPTRR